MTTDFFEPDVSEHAGRAAVLYCHQCPDTTSIDTRGSAWRIDMQRFVAAHAKRHGSVRVGFIMQAPGQPEIFSGFPTSTAQ